MKKKTGILILLLGVPVFLFLWGKFALTHHFELPIYYSQKIAENGDTIYHKTHDFKLSDINDQVVTNEVVSGKFYIAGFYKDDCKNDCMKMISQFVKIQESFDDMSDFRMILFTSDSMDAINEIYKNYEFTDKVIILSGRKDVITELALNSYFINNKNTQSGEFENKLVLVDKEKQIRGFYLGTENAQIDRLLTEVRLLDKIYNER